MNDESFMLHGCSKENLSPAETGWHERCDEQTEGTDGGVVSPACQSACVDDLNSKTWTQSPNYTTGMDRQLDTEADELLLVSIKPQTSTDISCWGGGWGINHASRKWRNERFRATVTLSTSMNITENKKK